MDDESKTNILVQNFPGNQREPPTHHKSLVKCMKKYGVSFARVNPSNELLRLMPLWHHPGEDEEKQQGNNGKKARCLRGNHAAITIGDGLDIARRLGNTLHVKTNSCVCDDCDDDRDTRGCEDPHACATKAVSRLGQIHTRWIPKPEVGIPQVEEPPGEDESRELFRRPRAITSLSEGMRAMTLRKGEPQVRPETRMRRRLQIAPAPEKTTVYIAGTIHTPANKKATAAAGIHIGTASLDLSAISARILYNYYFMHIY
ncbi:hypothetical protein B0H19DRAFT_934359 [Mycena capillaripes]|nr:hypothetical protein B0H19DRAFT_934359 [Mycena capillaripes]